MHEIAAVALFCEDVREEKQGTESVMGVFPNAINVSGFPGELNRLALYVRIHVATTWDATDLRIYFRNTDDSLVELSVVEKSFVEATQKNAEQTGFSIAGLITKAIMPNFVVPKAGTVVAFLKCRDVDVVIGALQFRQLPEEVTGA